MRSTRTHHALNGAPSLDDNGTANVQQGLQILLFVALAAVVVILVWGLINMFRGGSGNLSQKLMRARVIAQFIAIVLLMATLFFFAPR